MENPVKSSKWRTERKLSKEEKDLLLRDISARIPYGLKGQIGSVIYKFRGVRDNYVLTMKKGLWYDESQCITLVDYCKPFLRSLSSITDVEWIKIEEIRKQESLLSTYNLANGGEVIDYLNSRMLDWRGLIQMSLALEAPKDMYELI